VEAVEIIEEEDAMLDDDVEVVDEDAFGVTAKYATAPARTIITITITAVTIRDMARDALPFKLLTCKVF
jgi:hypothetical protein